MTMLSLPQLVELARRYGFPNPELAAAVAMAESGGNTCAQGDPNIGVHPCDALNGTSTSFGLWQIHVPAHREFDATRLLDPQYNAQAAFRVSSGGTNWDPWSTYKDNSYMAYYYPSAPELVVPRLPPAAHAAIFTLSALTLAAAAGYAAYLDRKRGWA